MASGAELINVLPGGRSGWFGFVRKFGLFSGRGVELINGSPPGRLINYSRFWGRFVWLWMALGGVLGRGEEEEGAGFAGEGGFSWGVQFSGGAGGSEGPGGAGWFWARKFII